MGRLQRPFARRVLHADLQLRDRRADRPDRFARRGRSIYTLEAHINYLHEIKEGTRVRVDMRVLAHDTKRLHLYLEMFADEGDTPVAAGEQMLLHVDTSGPRSVAFDADVAARVKELADAQAALPAAAYAGRMIGLPAAAQRSRSQQHA
jgi:acyl-CoA thioester hydrolase